ncbi:Radical SAM superfamily enzyme YgiQ, UPF0313 family [Tistlia consotensis]|uniref:Radical SAM superfamily enzyme YgiQ, UPF0313 family n=1 Tax=Tistlia consotensis USBA 355 TaxID=560819 RepID=A0A1Y6BM24_9PROT|nr:radical SAM protein [Tistlia consotensis]SMF16593.1 Radical SAM superfamily enzyme YgiQ, UPF0313 family [Tistlia consotensis USBA 355]SNR41006.1 Radical SAM superfamily enzyme YgiQ, UPF0313 family [Tistlia consotensis]
MVSAAKRRFQIVLIKPSHYDDDGYVIQWLRSAIPSNSLATLYGLSRACAEQQILGPEVEIAVEAYDEFNRIVPIRDIVQSIRTAGAGGFVGLVGVQSNQFPRALDIARQLRAAEVPVVVGGFHVSGCLAMLPELPADIREAQALGVSIYAGEAEGRLDEVLRDAYEGRLKPLYNYMDDLPGMEAATAPFLPAEVVRRAAGHYSSFDAGRGCPFQCSFCTIINVQGRVSRYRSADDVEALIRTNVAQGVRRFFITDDNFARNKNWEAILDRIIQLREQEGLNIKFIIQVDTLCHKTPRFIEKALRAGAHRIFVGLENINPDNLVAAKKNQNKIWEYRKMLQALKAGGGTTYAGYILGFPGDTPEKIARDVEILKRELPVDLVEFNILTPLPGSEDHRKMTLAGVRMDPDMNKYDIEHVTIDHPAMSEAELYRAYHAAWKSFYDREHLERVLRRAGPSGIPLHKMVLPLLWFAGFVAIENVHPVQGGWFRRKVRTQRRSGLPLENPLLFYPRRVWEVAASHARWLWLFLTLETLRRKILREGSIEAYCDESLEPVAEHDESELEMMHVHGGAIRKGYGAPVMPTAAE